MLMVVLISAKQGSMLNLRCLKEAVSLGQFLQKEFKLTTDNGEQKYGFADLCKKGSAAENCNDNLPLQAFTVSVIIFVLKSVDKIL